MTTVAEGDLVAGRFTHSFADLVVARAEDAVVPSGVPLQGAIGEPLGCIVEALRRSRADVGTGSPSSASGPGACACSSCSPPRRSVSSSAWTLVRSPASTA